MNVFYQDDNDNENRNLSTNKTSYLINRFNFSLLLPNSRITIIYQGLLQYRTRQTYTFNSYSLAESSFVWLNKFFFFRLNNNTPTLFTLYKIL